MRAWLWVMRIPRTISAYENFLSVLSSRACTTVLNTYCTPAICTATQLSSVTLNDRPGKHRQVTQQQACCSKTPYGSSSHGVDSSSTNSFGCLGQNVLHVVTLHTCFKQVCVHCSRYPAYHFVAQTHQLAATCMLHCASLCVLLCTCSSGPQSCTTTAPVCPAGCPSSTAQRF